MFKQHQDFSVVELWAEFLLGLQFLSDELDQSSEAWPAEEFSEVEKMLSDLRTGGPFCDIAGGTIALLQSAFEEALDTQTLGYQNRFDGIHDPDVGDVGSIVEERILTPQGARVQSNLDRFQALLRMRSLLAARLDADQQMAVLTSR